MKNGVLLFLSEVHLTNTGHLVETIYQTPEQEAVSCHQTNGATVKYLSKILASQGESIDRIFAFSTRRTQENIEYLAGPDNRSQQALQRDIFLQDVAEILPDAREHIVYIDFDENCPAESTMDYVMLMVDTIRDSIGADGREWNIYTDLTGGMRHAATLMLAVLHMLKYIGIGIGDAFYANYNRRQPDRNRIERVTVIHRMFELVSSTDAFINYARLDEIESYFQQVPASAQSQQLRQLLESFGRFSAAVQICRVGLFDQALQDMAQSVAEFKAYKGKSAQEKLFAQVLETLEQDYGTIFNPQSTHMDIIRWCIRKKFLQQAMTLFNEWIPAEIVRCKIFYPAPEYSHVISVACQKHNLGYKLDANVFVYEFYKFNLEQIAQKNIAAVSGKPLKDFRAFMQGGAEGPLPDNVPNAPLARLVDQLGSITEIREFYNCGLLKHEVFQSKYKELYLLLDYRRQKENKKTWSKFFAKAKLTKANLINYLANAPAELINTILGIENEASGSEKGLSEQPEKSSHGFAYEDILREMLEKKLAKTNVTTKELIAVLQNAYWLHKQRNEINHANKSQAAASNQQLEQCMLETMDAIEGVR